MRLGILAAVAATGILLSSAAHAATVTTSAQKVYVNSGGGYHVVKGTVTVKPGDTVMAGPNGSAAITWPDGCKSTVAPGAVVPVTDVSPCQATTGLDEFAVGALVVGAGVTAAVLISNNDNGASP